MRIIDENFLGIAEDEHEYRPTLVHGENLEPYHLYMVTHTIKQDLKVPIISMCYCLATSKEDAIAQTNSVPFGGKIIDDARTVTWSSTAVQIPFYIRGWGNNTF